MIDVNQLESWAALLLQLEERLRIIRHGCCGVLRSCMRHFVPRFVVEVPIIYHAKPFITRHVIYRPSAGVIGAKRRLAGVAGMNYPSSLIAFLARPW